MSPHDSEPEVHWQLEVLNFKLYWQWLVEISLNSESKSEAAFNKLE
jgi:hypothetical protein